MKARSSKTGFLPNVVYFPCCQRFKNRTSNPFLVTVKDCINAEATCRRRRFRSDYVTDMLTILESSLSAKSFSVAYKPRCRPTSWYKPRVGSWDQSWSHFGHRWRLPFQWWVSWIAERITVPFKCSNAINRRFYCGIWWAAEQNEFAGTRDWLAQSCSGQRWDCTAFSSGKTVWVHCQRLVI